MKRSLDQIDELPTKKRKVDNTDSEDPKYEHFIYENPDDPKSERVLTGMTLPDAMCNPKRNRWWKPNKVTLLIHYEQMTVKFRCGNCNKIHENKLCLCFTCDKPTCKDCKTNCQQYAQVGYTACLCQQDCYQSYCKSCVFECRVCEHTFRREDQSQNSEGVCVCCETGEKVIIQQSRMPWGKVKCVTELEGKKNSE